MTDTDKDKTTPVVTDKNDETPPPLPPVQTAPNADEVLVDRDAGLPAPGEPGSIYTQVISQEVSPQAGEPEAGLVAGINLPPPAEDEPVPADPYKPLVSQQAANDAVKTNARTQIDIDAEKEAEERERKRAEAKGLTEYISNNKKSNVAPNPGAPDTKFTKPNLK